VTTSVFLEGVLPIVTLQLRNSATVMRTASPSRWRSLAGRG
jgi:hypothetical protein